MSQLSTRRSLALTFCALPALIAFAFVARASNADSGHRKSAGRREAIAAQEDSKEKRSAIISELNNAFGSNARLSDAPVLPVAGPVSPPSPPRPGTGPIRPPTDTMPPPAERTRNWICSASCNVQQIDQNTECPDGTAGFGTGTSEDAGLLFSSLSMLLLQGLNHGTRNLATH